jgi:hypothetical protein
MGKPGTPRSVPSPTRKAYDEVRLNKSMLVGFTSHRFATILSAFMSTLFLTVPIFGQSQALPSGPASAQGASGPSLKETLDWLNEKIPLGSTAYVISEKCDPKTTCINGLPTAFTSNYVDRNAVWSLDSCNAVIGGILTITLGANTGSIKKRYKAPLGLLDGGTIERRENQFYTGTFVSGEKWSYYLFLNSKSKEISAETVDNKGAVVSAEATGSVLLKFNDETLAQRVLNAFNHAAELCRTKEPF